MSNIYSDDFCMACRLTKRPLGRVLVDGGFITPENLGRALEEQKESNEFLGVILVRMGLLSRDDIRAAILVQRCLISPEAAVRSAAGERQLLGRLLLQARRITPKKLYMALHEHAGSERKLGEALLRLGYITRSELDSVLAFQQHQSSQRIAGPIRLGEILVATGQITRKQLEDALERQRHCNAKIGEVLVESGDLQPRQIACGLKLQNKLITAALVAVLSLAPWAKAYAATPGSAGGQNLSVTAAVEANSDLEVIYQSPEMVVTNMDVLRGHVDSPSASHLRVTNRGDTGYMLVFDGLGGPFREVMLNGMGRDVHISSNRGWVVQPYAGRGVYAFELSYRFILSENAQPGTYAWPLTISVSPI
ncbi:MAG: hypothetical protein VST72_04145 [Nitrospirota bacterium]|nr:hypothetical protein [Nitrospirota bacterium]